VKNVDLFEVNAQILPLIGAENAQRQANQGPQMHHRIATTVMLAELMDLSMAVVAACDAVVGARGFNLLIFKPAVFQALLLESGLQKTATPAATIIVGAVGLHVDKIFFAHHRLDHKTEIFGNGITVTLANDLARILNRKLDFQVLVPIGIDLELALPNPFGIVLIDVFNFKIMLKIEFFQSGPD
jgi:hypothetical protein